MTTTCYDIPGSIYQVLFREDGFNLILFALLEGQEIPEHKTPRNAYLQCLEGKANVTIGGVAHPLKKGEIMLLPKDILHGIAALQATKLLLMRVGNEAVVLCFFHNMQGQCLVFVIGQRDNGVEHHLRESRFAVHQGDGAAGLALERDWLQFGFIAKQLKIVHIATGDGSQEKRFRRLYAGHPVWKPRRRGACNGYFYFCSSYFAHPAFVLNGFYAIIELSLLVVHGRYCLRTPAKVGQAGSNR